MFPPPDAQLRFDPRTYGGAVGAISCTTRSIDSEATKWVFAL
jgi:hypothetical protein